MIQNAFRLSWSLAILWCCTMVWGQCEADHNDSVFGKVDVRFLDLPLLMPAGELTERPESTWEVEHFSQLDIRVLRQDTEMRLPMRATSSRDFEAKGQVFFVLEPLCMPFEVDFTVGRRAGVWTVESTGGRQAWFPGSD